jgi:hypothetical protein
MFRANYAPKETEPMAYIVSHTWPDRWLEPGIKDGIIVYSNCEEVELFNDIGGSSLGRKSRKGIGTHFKWDGVSINYNVLYAVGYIDGKAVAKDYIVLRNLPQAPNFNEFHKDAQPITKAEDGYNYLYRMNCGGPDYTDEYGNLWSADRNLSDKNDWGSRSWTSEFEGVPSYFASQRISYDPVQGTRDWPLFQTFRYGREELSFEFPLPDGEYKIELYFNEPWLGTGGGMDCTGWRLFDVAVNGTTYLENIDIWKEAGHDVALKKTIDVAVKGGKAVISFPRVAAGQALISAIAIASKDSNIKVESKQSSLITNLELSGTQDWECKTWWDTGNKQYTDQEWTYVELPAGLYGADYFITPEYVKSKANVIANFIVTEDVNVFIAWGGENKSISKWLSGYEEMDTYLTTNEQKGRNYYVYRKRFEKGDKVELYNPRSEKMYNIAVLPISTLHPPHDLKPKISFKTADVAQYSEGIEKTILDKREALLISNDAQQEVSWMLYPGVADIYALSIRYSNMQNKEMKGLLELYSVDGTLMSTEDIEFTATRKDKWNYIDVTTKTMINAGEYILRLKTENSKGLVVYDLEMQ